MYETCIILDTAVWGVMKTSIMVNDNQSLVNLERGLEKWHDGEVDVDMNVSFETVMTEPFLS